MKFNYKYFVPAAAGFYVVRLDASDFDEKAPESLAFDLEPIVSWAYDAIGDGPVPCTFESQVGYHCDLVLRPDGKVACKGVVWASADACLANVFAEHTSSLRKRNRGAK